jgi:predicted ribosomally synthesized peptide with nif11-like leader
MASRAADPILERIDRSDVALPLADDEPNRGRLKPMSLDQLHAFLARMQEDQDLRQQVLGAATADDVAQIAAGRGFTFSGDELLRISGQKVGRVTVKKQDLPGEYN